MELGGMAGWWVVTGRKVVEGRRLVSCGPSARVSILAVVLGRGTTTL